MKTIRFALMIALLFFGVCSIGISVVRSAPLFEDIPVPVGVQFADPVLADMVRSTIGKPDDVITPEEAEAVRRLDLSNEWQRYISGTAVIKDLSGLEYFRNLEYLDLSDNAITDIQSLEHLTNLSVLSLAGNPVSDISALNGLTSLKILTLSNCQAQDYSPLSNLVNLELLKLDNSTIVDLSALGSLKKLKYLYLANSLTDDFSPLAEITKNLLDKDFMIPSTLKELGFFMDLQSNEAVYDGEFGKVNINHSVWGPTPWEWDANIIRLKLPLEGDSALVVGYYGDINAYVIQLYKDGKEEVNYVYDKPINVDEGKRERYEKAIRDAVGVTDDEEILLAPVRVFNSTIRQMFKMTPDALYALPFEPPTLTSLGFFPDKENAVWVYEQRGEKDVNIELNRPEWGENDFDIRFFTPLSDEYRIVVTYHLAEKKYGVGADDNSQGGAKFEYFVETGEHLDEWCSDNNLTVEEYFKKAFNDPGIKDVYKYSVTLVEDYFKNTFGMTIGELYALPTGEAQ